MKFFKKNINYFLLILVDIILLYLIFNLGIKIYKISKSQVKGVIISNIKRENVIFSNSNNTLKYFYEPKPNNVETMNPHWLGHKVQNIINSDTIHSKQEFSIQKDPEIFRILALGDSFTFGYGVNTNDNYVEKLQTLLNFLTCQNTSKFEVINIGVGGYDVEYAIERFKSRGIKYNPDLVIYLVNNWNFDKRNEFQIPLIRSFIDSGIQLQDQNTGEWTAYNKALQKLQELYSLKDIIEHQKNSLYSLFDFYKGELVILTFSSNPAPILNILTEFKKINHLYSVYTINDRKNDSKYILADRHPNEDGHALLAKDIFKILKENYFKKCSQTDSSY